MLNECETKEQMALIMQLKNEFMALHSTKARKEEEEEKNNDKT